MKDELVILNQIRGQLAYCMACYGDQPEKLMNKLEQLIIAWFAKGGINEACENKLS